MAENKFTRKDYKSYYKGIMMFNKNKDEAIHRWYPFVEGYSSEFIKSVVDELDYTPSICLDPFSGSGTTALELQKIGVECISYEVSPFMYDLTKTKLYDKYSITKFNFYLDELKKHLDDLPESISDYISFPTKTTYSEEYGKTKFHYDKEVKLGIIDIKYAIEKIDEVNYQRLFRIALASILIPVSNMYRNGKCLSYKKKFENRVRKTREEVHQIYLSFIENNIQKDIGSICDYQVSNYDLCIMGDCRERIKKIPDKSIDLIITSPPYLNSRDYTDSYLDELRILEYIKDMRTEREFRKKTIRSHVQVKWPEANLLDIKPLKEAYYAIEKYKENFWNPSILNMISGYFLDMQDLFYQFYRVLKDDKQIFFNVANSAYYNVIIPVDEIISQIAVNQGFKVVEIREARVIKSSSQQKNLELIESVIIIKK